MSTAHRVAKNTLFLYVRMAVSILVNIFTTRILLQALGVSDYGLYNVVGGAIAMLGFLSSSMSAATQRFISYAEGEGKADRIVSIFNNSVLIHRYLALAVVLLLAAGGLIFFNGVLNIPAGRETAAIFVYGCLLFSAVYSITIVPYDALLNAHENMRYYSLLGIADVIFKLIIALIVLFLDTERLILYAILMAAEAWLLRYLTKAYCLRHYSESRSLDLRRYRDPSSIRSMLSFAAWNLTSTASSMISLFGIGIVVNHYFGTTANAAMGVATQVSGVLMAVGSNMLKAITPVMVKKEGAHDRQQMLNISYIGSRFNYLLYAFFGIPLLFWLHTLLNLWLTVVPDWTIIFCAIAIINAIVESLTVFLHQTIMAEGNIRNYNIAYSVCNILPILLSILVYALFNLAPYWAMIFWGIFKAVFGGLVKLYYCKRNIGLSLTAFNKFVTLPCMYVTVICVVISYLVSQIPAPNTILSLGYLLSIYLLSVPFYWFIALQKSERQQIKSMIPSFGVFRR